MAQSVVAQRKGMTRKRLMISVVLIVVVCGFIVFSPYGIVTRWQLQSDITKLENNKSIQLGIKDSLQHYIKVLQTDTSEIERLARERYGYVRSNETVFIIR
jgi:cell division protein FtsB